MTATQNFPSGPRVGRHPATLVALVTVALLTVGPATRADHIDDELKATATDLVKTLKEKGFKTVGVLKFLVKKGKGPLDGGAGALNTNMAERIENAIIHGDEAGALAVTEDATTEAAKANPKFSIRSVEARKALFAHKYPLRWGTEKATPDVFVTGTVDLAADMRTATVELGYFDKTGVTHDLKSFKVKTDRSILADSGQSFVVSQRSLKGKNKRALSELDDAAADSAAQADKGTGLTQQLAKDGEAPPLKFEVLYNGGSQAITPDPNSQGEYRVDSPRQGQVVTFNLTNTTQGKIGVVVKVNGISTIDRETGEDPACTKWVLEPGKPYQLKGFYAGGKVFVFNVLSDEESAARVADEAFHGRGGWIDVTVFTEGPDVETGETPGTSRSFRNLTARGGKKEHPKSHAEARALVQKNLGTKAARKTRGLLAEGAAEDKALEKDELKTPTASFNMRISYYTPPTDGAKN
jgi:hypothetical protein